jgi:hypothetical protein
VIDPSVLGAKLTPSNRLMTTKKEIGAGRAPQLLTRTLRGRGQDVLCFEALDPSLPHPSTTLLSVTESIMNFIYLSYIKYNYLSRHWLWANLYGTMRPGPYLSYGLDLFHFSLRSVPSDMLSR